MTNHNLLVCIMLEYVNTTFFFFFGKFVCGDSSAFHNRNVARYIRTVVGRVLETLQVL